MATKYSRLISIPTFLFRSLFAKLFRSFAKSHLSVTTTGAVGNLNVSLSNCERPKFLYALHSDIRGTCQILGRAMMENSSWVRSDLSFHHTDKVYFIYWIDDNPIILCMNYNRIGRNNTIKYSMWNLRVDPKQGFLAIIVMESQGLPTMKCQTKCANAIVGGRFLSTMTEISRWMAVTGQLS